MAMNTVKLTDEQLELVRRGMMKEASTDLRNAIDEIDNLAIVAPWPTGSKSSDAQNAVRLAREGLDVLDALGWPADETREQWEARMKSTAGEA